MEQPVKVCLYRPRVFGEPAMEQQGRQRQGKEGRGGIVERDKKGRKREKDIDVGRKLV